jgi:hypothetical protein
MLGSMLPGRSKELGRTPVHREFPIDFGVPLMFVPLISMG